MTSLRALQSALVIVALVAGFSTSAMATGHHQFARTITVTGQGEASGAPDQAQINAGVQTLAPTVAEASRENQDVVDRIMAALKKLGVKEKDIQTANYSIWPEQQHDPRGSGEITITGYRVNNTVNVTIENVEQVGKVLAAVTDAGANTVHGINFGVKDSKALEQRARAAAMADARERAEALAELAGVELGDVQTISMTAGGGYPVPMMGGRMEMAQSASVPGISTGELSIFVQVQVSYAIN